MVQRSKDLLRATLFLCCLVFMGCGEEADIPVYITVNEPTFETLPNQGTDFQDSDIFFLFHNNSALGAFPYGNEIPLLADGMDDIVIYPGVRMDGFQAMPEINFMFNSITYTRDFVPGTDYSFSPTFTYDPDVDFRIVEDFETGNAFNADIDDDPMTKMELEAGIGFDNSYGGIMRTSPEKDLVAVAHDVQLNNFPPGLPIIVELSHNNSTQMVVSVWANYPVNPSQEFQKIFLVPTDGEWKKLYLDMGELIRTTNATSVQLMFAIRYDETVDDNYAIIDDVKLMHL